MAQELFFWIDVAANRTAHGDSKPKDTEKVGYL